MTTVDPFISRRLGRKLADEHATPELAGMIATSVVDPKQGRVVNASGPLIVGITGHVDNGKDTAGKRFIAKGFMRFGFADQLKSMALALNPWIVGLSVDQGNLVYSDWAWARLATIVDAIGWEQAKEIEEVRRFLQVLGTEGVREHIGENAWIDALAKQVRESQARRVVITDVRFPNEAKWVHDRGGVVIRVVRLNEDGSIYDSGVSKDHGSERFVEDLPVDEILYAHSVAQLNDLSDMVAEEVLFGR